MGLFSFVKSVGKKIGIGGDEDAPAAESVKAEMDSHDLGTKNVEVEVKGDTVVLKGDVADQSAFEKAIVAVGNTLGISKVDTAALKVGTQAAKDPVFYTVVKGDNLSKIAKAHYGNANKYPAIFEANKPMLTHPDKIYPGQVLRIPEQG